MVTPFLRILHPHQPVGRIVLEGGHAAVGRDGAYQPVQRVVGVGDGTAHAILHRGYIAIVIIRVDHVLAMIRAQSAHPAQLVGALNVPDTINCGRRYRSHDLTPPHSPDFPCFFQYLFYQ
jgi:hypothetical protein